MYSNQRRQKKVGWEMENWGKDDVVSFKWSNKEREREREREREGRERENPEKGCKRSLSKVVVVAFGRGEGI